MKLRNKDKYPEPDQNVDFAALEENVLQKWAGVGTFNKSVRGATEFVFYDGPPFANGLPHYGHLLTGFIKDTFARYQTMLGKKVERRFGWDCHGLPAEMGAEKALGVSGRVAIEQYGISKFNDYCRSDVLKYTNEWEYYVTRQGRWVDFKNDYKTMNIDFMESVIWAFKTLYDKGLLYESFRVMPYSWACQTPVSDFETRMDNSYRQKASKAVTVMFELKDPSALGLSCKAYMLAWTTTPWTLPSNMALAVGAEVEYVAVLHDGKACILAKALLSKYQDLIGSDIISEFAGINLCELEYKPLLPYFSNHENAFKIFEGEFVTTEDGTGIVHCAPGFGEDDYNLCNKHNIDVVCPVDEGGKFTAIVKDFAGMQVFDAEDGIIKMLKEQGLWLKTEQYLHNYPYCWRTDTPLIYKAVPSWYLKVTQIRDKMVANNQKINWIPNHIKDGLFGKWLENARDWSISRDRFWGCPIPIWKSDDDRYPHIEVYGSIAELEDAFGVKVEDLHRPFIDTLVKDNPKDPTGKSKMRRVHTVLDCWFESGSMPYAQMHYPFENKETFEKHFPAHFIVEYLAQTRGWFYTLLVLSTALFDSPPFLNCICHGVILGDGGQKLSKRLKNYADPKEVFDTIGADAMRWFMLSSPVMRGQEMAIDKDAKVIKEMVRLIMKPIWNAYNFFCMYANVDGIIAEYDVSSPNLLDKYIISKCNMTVTNIKSSMDEYDSISATKAAEEFFEVLNNWYIRRCRERFWRSKKDSDKIHAYNTLYYCLKTMVISLASLLPMLTEEIYLGLTLGRELESVHLERYLVPNYKPDTTLIADMEKIRDACATALYIRNECGIRVRQPLKAAIFIGICENAFNKELEALILDEINVKSWISLSKSEIEKYAEYKLQIVFAKIGKRLPEKVRDIIAAAKSDSWKLLDDGRVELASVILERDEFELKLAPKPSYGNKIAPLPTNEGLVLLDTELTPELVMEGIARDLVRFIQQARKNASFMVTDRVIINVVTTSEEVHKAILIWRHYIMEQTLCIDLESSPSNPETVEYTEEVTISDYGKFKIELSRHLTH